MPIEVRYSPEAGGIAALAAIAGALQSSREDSLRQPRTPIRVGGGGGGGGRTSSSDPFGMGQGYAPSMSGVRSPEEELRLKMQANLKQEQFGGPIVAENLRKQTQVQFDEKFSAQQRQDIAKFNTARQQIIQSNNFNPEEKRTALRLLDLQQSSIQPNLIPRDPSAPQYPEGQDVGQIWTDPNGFTYTRDKDGIPKLTGRPDQTVQYMEQKAKQAQEEKAFEIQSRKEEKAVEFRSKQDEKMLDQRMKLATELIDVTGADGKETSRYRKPEEIDAIIRAVYGGGQQQLTPQQQQEVSQWQAENDKWMPQAQKAGIIVKDIDRNLPPVVANAQAIVRTFGTADVWSLSDENKLRLENAKETLRNYRIARGAGR